MERREFLKLTVGFAAAAGAIAATAIAAQAAPAPLPQGDATKAADPHETPARSDTDKLEQETAARDGDTDFSAQRWRRRRRRVFFRRRRRFWRRRRRVFY